MLKPQKISEIPAETKRVAKAAFAKSNINMRLRDEFGVLFEDQDFSDLYPNIGQPAIAPWQLAMVTLMQYLENLTDRQAANAVKSRIDWKYCLGLKLEDTGFDYSVLSEFRKRLVEAEAQERILDKMLEHFKVRGLIQDKGKQRSDSTHVLANIRVMNRLELVAETMRAMLNELAEVEPDWLRGIAEDSWYERYGARIEDNRLPKSQTKRDTYGKTIGEDGFKLLDALELHPNADILLSLPKVAVLIQIWERHYERKGERVKYRDSKDLPKASETIESPYETEARFSRKRNKKWVGYKAHFTETCNEKSPNLIVNVLTTQATKQDVSCTKIIHDALDASDRIPEQHYVDAGYTDAELLANSQEDYGIKLIGPARPNPNWQSKVDGGITLYDFDIDWDKEEVTCPKGHTSRSWRQYLKQGDYPQDTIQARFSSTNCNACDLKTLCTRSEKQGRIVNFQPQAQFEALKQAREYIASDEGQQDYRIRAGVEGTIAQAVGAFGGRRSRYRGQAKTHFQQTMISTAINVVRVDNYLQNIPKGKTYISRFQRLQTAA